MEKTGTNRRDFIKKCVAGAVAVGASESLAFGLPAAAAKGAAGKSRVVLARDASLRVGGNPDPKRVAALLDTAMQRCFGSRSPLEPWKQIVKKGDVVGLKINCIAAPGLYSNKLLVEAICARLQRAGIKPGDIVVWDRTERELKRAGFAINTDPNKGVRFMGTDTSVGYEEQAETHGAASCKLSKILTRTCSTVINVPVLKNHGITGVTGAMKNMYGVINNPQNCHGNHCNPYVADVMKLPGIQQKIHFHICDVITSVFEGGPSYNPQYAYHYNGVMVSRDPVALDHCGWQIVEKMRAEKGLKPLSSIGMTPAYIATAADAQHQLGTNDPKRIDWLQV
jgi:uncharacterized protein (DUF362 family)